MTQLRAARCSFELEPPKATGARKRRRGDDRGRGKAKRWGQPAGKEVGEEAVDGDKIMSVRQEQGGEGKDSDADSAIRLLLNEANQVEVDTSKIGAESPTIEGAARRKLQQWSRHPDLPSWNGCFRCTFHTCKEVGS